MVHLVGMNPGDTGFMFFNVDRPVGANAGTTNRDDVLLVQFFLFSLEFRSEPPDGNNDQKTIEQIKAFQSAGLPLALGPPDGRVSVAKGRRYGAFHYTIVGLNGIFRARKQSEWPLIHRSPRCPPELATKVNSFF
jgi:hypothetical protein